MNLSDLQLHEKFCAMRTLTLGKAYSDPATIAYLRQYWTSHQYPFATDWVHHLFHSHFNTDFTEILRRISALAALADGMEPSLVSEKLLDEIVPWFRNFLKRNYGVFAGFRSYLRRKTPGVLIWLKTRRRFSVPIERRVIFRKLRKNGANEDYISAFAKELIEIEDVISGNAFHNFIRPWEAKLATNPGRKPHGEVTAQLGPVGRGQSA